MKNFVLEVWGDFACFTRPETKEERFTYPVMTPSAARGVLDAIYAKPIEFCWRIDKIEVLKPFRFIALKRNEVKEKVSKINDKIVLKGGEFPLIIADDTGNDQKGRTQRQTIALKDVSYRIHAHIELRKSFENNRNAIEDQAIRRIAQGKCYYQPYLGCREFVAYFKFAEDEKPAVSENIDIGYMIYDIFDLDRTIIDNAPSCISVFKAELKEGVLEIPAWESEAVKKPR